jgi:hypothetical protein
MQSVHPIHDQALALHIRALQQEDKHYIKNPKCHVQINGLTQIMELVHA